MNNEDCGCNGETAECKSEPQAVDVSKAQKGDKVRFICGGEAVVDRVVILPNGLIGLCFAVKALMRHDYFNGGQCVDSKLLNIIAIEPAPFDWATVRPGMAFKWLDDIVHYVGPDFDAGYLGRRVYCTNDKCVSNYGVISFIKSNLTRAREHDIQVTL